MIDDQNAPFWIPDRLAAHGVEGLDGQWGGRVGCHGRVHAGDDEFALVNGFTRMAGNYFFNDGLRHDYFVEWIRFLFFLDRIYRIDGILFACGEISTAERPMGEGRSLR